jgi:hypothetical protein
MPQGHDADLTVGFGGGVIALCCVRLTRFKQFHRIVHHEAVELNRLRFI